jgi:hypothetical protein
MNASNMSSVRSNRTHKNIEILKKFDRFGSIFQESSKVSLYQKEFNLGFIFILAQFQYYLQLPFNVFRLKLLNDVQKLR